MNPLLWSDVLFSNVSEPMIGAQLLLVMNSGRRHLFSNTLSRLEGDNFILSAICDVSFTIKLNR